MKAAKNEAKLLQQHTAVLVEHLEVTKDMLATKTREVEECEYQWAVAKAKNAEMESERLALADDRHMLASIIGALKAGLARGGSQQLPSDVRAMLSAQQLQQLMEM